jgi:hypothetical protein
MWATIKKIFDDYIDEWNRNGAEPAPIPIRAVKATRAVAKVKR